MIFLFKKFSPFVFSTLICAQRLLLALYSGNPPGRAQGSNVVSGSATHNKVALTAGLPLHSRDIFSYENCSIKKISEKNYRFKQDCLQKNVLKIPFQIKGMQFVLQGMYLIKFNWIILIILYLVLSSFLSTHIQNSLCYYKHISHPERISTRSDHNIDLNLLPCQGHKDSTAGKDFISM